MKIAKTVIALVVVFTLLTSFLPAKQSPTVPFILKGQATVLDLVGGAPFTTIDRGEASHSSVNMSQWENGLPKHRDLELPI